MQSCEQNKLFNLMLPAHIVARILDEAAMLQMQMHEHVFYLMGHHSCCMGDWATTHGP
jgi:hypothetical protein